MELGEQHSSLRTHVRPPNERMLTLAALIVLFTGILLLSSILLYTLCYLRRVRRRQNRGPRPRPRHRIYLSASDDVPKSHHGLDARVLTSLPVFTFSAAESTHPVDCAVCLSEFEENESGRILPKCKHSFHIDCIDMWFYSHSTCPLCRATVEEHHTDQPADPELVNLSVSDHVVSSEHKEQVVLVVPVRLMEDRDIGADDGDRNSSEAIGSTSASPTTRSLPIITRMLSLKIRLLRSQRIMKETASCGGPDLEPGEDHEYCNSSSSSSTVDSFTSPVSLQTN